MISYLESLANPGQFAKMQNTLCSSVLYGEVTFALMIATIRAIWMAHVDSDAIPVYFFLPRSGFANGRRMWSCQPQTPCLL